MSFQKQTLLIEEKKANYRALNEKYKSMSWLDVREEFIKNHPTRYFDKIKNLDISLDDKIQLMQDFFRKQLHLIQAQQSLSEVKVGFGPPISAGTLVLNSHGSGTTGNSEQIPVPVEVTRSGRVTKRPLFYTETFQESNSPNDSASKPTKVNNKVRQKSQSDKKENVPKEEVKKYTNVNAKRTISKYETQRNMIFDRLLTNENSEPNSESQSDKNSENRENDKKTDENNWSEDDLFSPTPENVTLNALKRKYEDVTSQKNSPEKQSLEENPLVTKRNKRNRFFVSKNRQEEHVIKNDNIVNCDSSDSDTIEQQRNEHPQITDTADIPDSPSILNIQKRPYYRKRPVETFPCPICGEKFSEHEIPEHASACGDS